MDKKRVVVIDGSELFALGIRSLLLENELTGVDYFQIIKTRSEIELDDSISLIIVGQALLDHMQFEEILKIINEQKRNSYVLLIPEMINSKTAKQLFARRAIDGIISRNCSGEDLVTAIRTVLKGEIYIGKDINLHQNNEQTVLVTKKDNPYYLIQKLTPQEKKIMDYVIEGKSSTNIGHILYRSVHTIKTHRKNMLHKLGVTNTIELITFLDSVNYRK